MLQRLKRKIGAAHDGNYEADDDSDEEIEHNAGGGDKSDGDGSDSDDEYDDSSFASTNHSRVAETAERRITRSSRQQARQSVASSDRDSDSDISSTSAAKLNQGDQQQASDMKAW